MFNRVFIVEVEDQFLQIMLDVEAHESVDYDGEYPAADCVVGGAFGIEVQLDDVAEDVSFFYKFLEGLHSYYN